MKYNFTILLIIIIQIFASGQSNKYRIHAEELVKNFYEGLNNYCDKSFSDLERLQFREDVENNIFKPGKTILVNDFYEFGSDKLSAEEYLNALNSFFPDKNNNAKFNISNVVADIPKTLSNMIICKVYYSIQFTGIFNDNSKIDKKNNMIATVVYPENEIARAFIPKTEFSTQAEIQNISDKTKQFITMNKDWEKIKDSSTADDYRRFLNKYPDSEFNNLAKAKLDELEMKDKKKIEDKDWIEAKNTNTILSYKKFLRKHPYSEYSNLAKVAKSDLEDIAEEKKDNKAWELALKKNTRKAYLEYLKNYPLGYHTEEANKKIKEIDIKNRGNLYIKGKKVGGAGSALYSLLYPGWGDYKVNTTRAPYFIIGVAAYGLTGVGGYYYSQYLKNSDNYAKATDPDKIKEYRNLYEKQFSTSKYLIGAGVLVWVTDVILVAVKGSKNSKEYKKLNKKISYTPYSSYNKKNDIVSVGLKITF